LLQEKRITDMIMAKIILIDLDFNITKIARHSVWQSFSYTLHVCKYNLIT